MNDNIMVGKPLQNTTAPQTTSSKMIVQLNQQLLNIITTMKVLFIAGLLCIKPGVYLCVRRRSLCWCTSPETTRRGNQAATCVWLKCISSSTSPNGRTSTGNSHSSCLDRFNGHTRHLLRHLLPFLRWRPLAQTTELKCDTQK